MRGTAAFTLLRIRLPVSDRLFGYSLLKQLLGPHRMHEMRTNAIADHDPGRPSFVVCQSVTCGFAVQTRLK